MKIKLLLATLAVAGLAASSAVAAPPEGKGKPRTGEGCKPKIAVVLKGTLVSASTTTLSMNVTGANRWGRAYKNAGSANVTLDSKTKVRGHGMKSVADLLARLKAGDRVHVQARVCKDDLKDPTAKPALIASKVIGHPAKAAKDEKNKDEKNKDDDD
jgi:hypothetical protein